MKVIVSWSGGKDSQACLIWAVNKYKAKNVTAVFCDTGWEHEKTYRHVKLIAESLGVKLIILKSSKFNGFVDLAIKKQRMPSTKARFCTEELKIKPMIDFILSQEDNLLIIQGIRNEESKARSNMFENCRYFKYYFEPYQNNSMIIDHLNSKSLERKLSYKEEAKLEKAKQRLSEGKEDNKFHAYRKKEVLEWCKKYADDIQRPIIKWTANETINYSLENNLPLNPLYYEGAGRVGCYPCVMCTKGEIKNIIDNDFSIIDKIRQAEKESGSSFFSPNYVPVRYRRQTDTKGNKYCLIDDVVSYIQDRNSDASLFAEIEKEEKESSGRRCMSVYNICE